MTDSAFMLTLLEERPRTTMQIIRESIEQRGCGLTPHSRAADLRRQGHNVRCERVGTTRGRGVFLYELVRQPVQMELVS